MAIIDGKKACHDQILEVAKLAGIAALKAPKMANTEVHVDIITGEDLLPLSEILGIVGEASAFVDGDSKVVSKNYKKGEPVVELLVGADTTYSDLGWDCGACGFSTCAEFNKYAKEHKSPGQYYSGPSCNWKAFDFGVAQAWACAAVHQNNVENRAQTSYGAVALWLGYQAGCNLCVGISMGPNRDLTYFSRKDYAHEFNMEEHEAMLMRVLPDIFNSFVGGGFPMAKYSEGMEWMAQPKYFSVQENAAALEKMMDIKMRVGAVIQRELSKKMDAK